MKKKIFTLFLAVIFVMAPVFAKVDRTSENYLVTKKHFSVMSPLVSYAAKKVIKRQLKKETGANFNVKFKGYTVSSMKAGVFKDLEITGKKVTISDIYIPYIKLKTVSEYNWIDYTQNPPAFKSNMDFAYNMHLSEKSLNDALSTNEYQEVIRKLNRNFYPIISIYNIKIELKDSLANIALEYNIPLRPFPKNKVIRLTSEFKVVNGKINATNVTVDSRYGNLPIAKITNLLNILNPLSFTIGLVGDKKCDGKIENIKIVDDIIQINGRIFVEGDN